METVVSDASEALRLMETVVSDASDEVYVLCIIYTLAWLELL